MIIQSLILSLAGGRAMVAALLRCHGRGRSRRVFLAVLWLLLGPVCASQVLAQTGLEAEDNLLPVEQAFKLRVDATARGITLHWDIAPNYYLYRSHIHIQGEAGTHPGTLQLPPGKRDHDEYLGEVETYRQGLEATLPYTVEDGARGLQLAVQYQGCHETDPKICYPPHTQHLQLPLPAAASSGKQAPAAEATPRSRVYLWLAALGGGLLLNLLPCVLPVLFLKVLGVLESRAERKRLQRHAVAYTLGVLASFTAIDLIAHALGRSLGAQLQTPWIVGVLACVMLSLGLSLSGLGTLGNRWSGLGQRLADRGGWLGDFFTGVLAVVVAAPCTGPLMGPPVAYALTAPLLPSLAVFLCLGLGLALPLLLIAWLPAVSRLLPQPGRWMETLKQLLAFPMYFSAIWLIWVLAKQRGADAVALVLIAGVLLAMALWWQGRSRERRTRWQLVAPLLALLAGWPLYALTRLPASQHAGMNEQTPTGAVAYSPERLAALRQQGQSVFVDMSADWCVTCKANEHTALSGPAFRQLLASTGTVYMAGDWTDVNPTIAAFLQRYHSPGVPLYVVFPKDGGPGRVLPTVLTPALVRAALTQASR